MSAPDALELGRGLPGWTLRVVVAGAVAGIVLVLTGAGLSGVVLGVICLAGIAVVLLPSSPAPMLLLVLTALSVVALDPGDPRMLALVPLVHLMHVGCAVAGLLPAGSRVHPAALRAPAVRFVAVQAAVLALAGLVTFVPRVPIPAALEFTAIVGVAGIAVLLAWLLHRPQ